MRDRLHWALIFIASAVLLLQQQGGSVFAPPPIDSRGLAVLVVYESSDELPYRQQAALDSGEWRDLVDRAGGEWRMFDADQDLRNESAMWRDAFARERDALPWIVVSNGRTGTEQPFPAELADVLELVDQYAGEGR